MGRNTIKKDNFPTTLGKDLFEIACGKKLGSGCSRDTFECALNPKYVIKIENSTHSFQNIMEWEVWESVKYEDDGHAKPWFAPCEYISPCGIVLVQHKTTVPTREQFPAKLPAFFSDIQKPNFGMYEGRFVCHDYGYNDLMEVGKTKRLKKAEWWWDDD